MTNSTRSSLSGAIGGAASFMSGNPMGILASGAGIAALLGRQPKLPDLMAETNGQYADAERRLMESAQGAQRRLGDDLAATGATGSGGALARTGVARAALSANSALDSQRADALARSRNEMERMRYEQQAGARQARLGGALGLLRTAGMAQMLGKEGVQPEPGVVATAPIAAPMVAPALASTAPAPMLSPELLALLQSRGFSAQPSY